MTRRDILTRVVLVMASAASIATSEPVNDELPGPIEEDEGVLVGLAVGRVSAPEPRHVSVRFSGEVVAQADELWIQFRWPEGEQYDLIAILPDDDSLPELQLVTDDPETLEASAACREDASCSIGFTIDPVHAEPGPTVADIEVRAEARRHGGSFSFGAAIQVVFDDE